MALDTSTGLAFERTRLAYDRTLQAWLRTAVSLISFGFSINKFFEVERTPDRFLAPYGISFMMVGIGLISLFLATLEYRRNLRDIHYAGKRSIVLPIATLISLMGILALVSMVVH